MRISWDSVVLFVQSWNFLCNWWCLTEWQCDGDKRARKFLVSLENSIYGNQRSAATLCCTKIASNADAFQRKKKNKKWNSISLSCSFKELDETRRCTCWASFVNTLIPFGRVKFFRFGIFVHKKTNICLTMAICGSFEGLSRPRAFQRQCKRMHLKRSSEHSSANRK